MFKDRDEESGEGNKESPEAFWDCFVECCELGHSDVDETKETVNKWILQTNTIVEEDDDDEEDEEVERGLRQRRDDS